MRKILKLTVAEYYCDRCGAQLLGYEEAEFYTNCDIWEEEAQEAGWTEISGKHYCDRCWVYDDDDNPTPREPKQFKTIVR